MNDLLWLILFASIFLAGFFTGRFFENNRFIKIVTDALQENIEIQKEIEKIQKELEKYSDDEE